MWCAEETGIFPALTGTWRLYESERRRVGTADIPLQGPD
jgi:hypothetical protein